MPDHYTPKSRTPYRLELKFTVEEWELIGKLANASQRSRYNFCKHVILQHKPIPEHNHLHKSVNSTVVPLS